MNTTLNKPISQPSAADFERLENADVVPQKGQRSPEWYAARRGRFTGSEIWKLMTEPRTKAAKEAGELSDTAMTYVNQVLAELITGITPEVFAHSMQWGVDHEDEAREVYKTYFAEEIATCDFIPYGDFGGGSPDGFILKNHSSEGIAEIKCPYNSGGHIENMMLAHKMADPDMFKEYHKEYYWQMQNNLMVTDVNFCRFISFDPRFTGQARIARITMPRVESDIILIKEKIARASVVLSGLKNALGF